MEKVSFCSQQDLMSLGTRGASAAAAVAILIAATQLALPTICYGEGSPLRLRRTAASISQAALDDENGRIQRNLNVKSLALNTLLRDSVNEGVSTESKQEIERALQYRKAGVPDEASERRLSVRMLSSNISKSIKSLDESSSIRNALEFIEQKWKRLRRLAAVEVARNGELSLQSTLARCKKETHDTSSAALRSSLGIDGTKGLRLRTTLFDSVHFDLNAIDQSAEVGIGARF